MSVLNLHPEDCKLILNFFYADETYLEEAISYLEGVYGPIDLRMDPMVFDHTNYYVSEMGENLKKVLISFRDLVGRESLVEIKHETTRLEQEIALRFGQNEKRIVNIDPGHLLPEKFVLSTGKNFPQRIYLDRGVYAELTLIYRHNRFEPLPWTYVDYLEEQVLDFLSGARKILMKQLTQLRAEMNVSEETRKPYKKPSISVIKQ